MRFAKFHIAVLPVYVAVFHIFSLNSVRCSSNDDNCTVFLNTYQERILGTSVMATPDSASLKYCSVLEKTCCTADVEEKLKEVSRVDFEKTLKKRLYNLGKSFKTKSTKFNEFFKDLLTKSKKDFHEMFKKTYGIVYEQNSYVFSDFFTELESYFSHGKSSLADVMDTFFNILYQKMFTVMNSQFRFDDKYLGCVSEHMNELKPFGDVPQKLSLPLKRSFVAARTYAQSLNVVGDIVNNLVNVLPAENCFEGLLKMSHCSACNGLMNVKVCYNFCLNVMKGCLAFHAEVDTEWKAFVDAFNKVQQRLLGPFNIELVVEPINVKISEAIMNFQESATQISNKVFNGCGKPPLLDSKRRRRRRRRETNDFLRISQFAYQDDRNTNARNDHRRKEKSGVAPNQNRRNDKNKRKGSKDNYDLDQYRTSPIDGFLKFIKEIGSQVVSTRPFWKRLPDELCSEEMNVENNRSGVCWNGVKMGSYDVVVVSDGMRNQQTNPEVPMDLRRSMNSINEQISALKAVSSQLRNAYNGLDVEFIDSDETFDTGSGSGFSPDADSNDNLEANFEGSGHVESTSDFGIKFDSPTVISDLDSGNNHVRRINDNVSTTEMATSGSVFDSSISTSSFYEMKTTPKSFVITSTEGVNNVNITSSSGGTAIKCEKMPLNAAIASYLLPTIVIWVGGSFNDWFHTISNRS